MSHWIDRFLPWKLALTRVDDIAELEKKMLLHRQAQKYLKLGIEERVATMSSNAAELKNTDEIRV